MKKVLILSTSTGEGHNQAAKSLESTLEYNNFEVHRHDFLQKNSKVLSTAFIGGYDFFASKFPSIYGLAYRLTDNFLSTWGLNVAYTFTRIKIKKLIDEIQPDFIISTHPFAVPLLGSLKRKGMNIPTMSIVTDFKAHYSYYDKDIDYYITGSEYTKIELVKLGLNKKRIYPLGIPVRDDFYLSCPELLTTKDDDYFNILLMGGSMGLNNIKYVLKELLNNKNKLRITVVCGNNKKLKDSLLSEYKNKIRNKKLHILGYCSDIPSIMEYSDLLISKPGGLTVTEAFIKNLPIVIAFAIPGQEIYNTEFLCENNYALKVDSLLELNLMVDSLIDNPSELQKLKSNISNVSTQYSKQKIVDLINLNIKN